MAPFLGDEERLVFHHAGKLFDEGDYEGAADLWNEIRLLYPFEAMMHFVVGRSKHMMKSLDEALVFYKKTVELNPEFWQAYYYMGSILIERAQYRQAMDVLYFLLKRQPSDGNAWTLLGGVLSKIGEHDDALVCCRQALKMNPDDAAAMYNLAFACSAKNDVAEALTWIEAALQRQPEVPAFHLHRAAVLLRTGRYAEGWREWEWRLLKEDFRALNVRSAMPRMWRGQPLAGKTLLVWCEQGYGDTVQFARYITEAKKQGARVVFECQKELIPILSTMDSVDAIFERFSPAVEPFDYHVPVMSLPLHFDTTPQSIPAAEGYLDPAVVQMFADRFSFSPEEMKIGLAWEGSRLNAANHHRSCSPDAYSPLLGLPQCSFYGLQHESGEVAIPPAISNIGVRSMSELAGAIALMDLVITIDTSVAHLAGAMGKEVWLLLSALPDWRWELEDATSPWYASMHILRQKKIGEWLPVMTEAADRLRARITLEQPTLA